MILHLSNETWQAVIAHYEPQNATLEEAKEYEKYHEALWDAHARGQVTQTALDAFALFADWAISEVNH